MFGAAVRPVNKSVISPTLADGEINDRRHFLSFWFNIQNGQMMKTFPLCTWDILLTETGSSILDLFRIFDHWKGDVFLSHDR